MALSIQQSIVQDCEIDLRKFGDTFEGAGWTKKKAYADRRYQVMLDIIPPTSQPVSVLDFGCGISHLYEYVRARKISNIAYSGLDLSDSYLALSRRKFPEITYYQTDLMDASATIPMFDYILMSGVLTYKGGVAQAEMTAYAQALLKRVASFARVGFAFNIMSKHVDWERDDLFHLSFTELSTFLDRHISRRFTIRHDYDLFEYTTYVYVSPLPEEPEPAGTTVAPPSRP